MYAALSDLHYGFDFVSTVELSRVGGVRSAVVTRFTISCAVELLRCGDKWRLNDVIVEKKLSILIKFHVVKPLWSLFGQFPNCRPNPSAVVVS